MIRIFDHSKLKLQAVIIITGCAVNCFKRRSILCLWGCYLPSHALLQQGYRGIRRMFWHSPLYSVWHFEETYCAENNFKVAEIFSCGSSNPAKAVLRGRAGGAPDNLVIYPPRWIPHWVIWWWWWFGGGCDGRCDNFVFLSLCFLDHGFQCRRWWCFRWILCVTDNNCATQSSASSETPPLNTMNQWATHDNLVIQPSNVVPFHIMIIYHIYRYHYD